MTVVTVVKREAAAVTTPRRTRQRVSGAGSQTTTSAAPTFKACDPNIRVRAATTSCEFAENVFYEYWAGGGASALRAYSPTTQATYDVDCTSGGGRIVCSTAGDGEVRFSQAAVDAYTYDQAAAYAARADIGPEGTPPDLAGDDYGSGSYGPGDAGSDDSGSADDDGSGGGFCDTHACIPNFDNGSGSIVQCADGEYSQSGGRPGACSGHGGEG